MIAENDKIIQQTPVLTDCKGAIIATIIGCMKLAISPFKNARSQPNLHHPLNENKLTQIYVEQVEVFIKPISNLGVKNQYSDIFFGTRGVPDFYFHIVEEGKHHKPLFIVEAKRLPAPGQQREREYVAGRTGGIERYKRGSHGTGLDECGMLGFVEEDTFSFWEQNINTWITELSSTTAFWQPDEILGESEEEKDFATFRSIAYREHQEVISLHHLWIDIAEG